MIWELRAQIDGFSSLVIVDDADIRAGMFAVNGSPKDWAHRLRRPEAEEAEAAR